MSDRPPPAYDEAVKIEGFPPNSVPNTTVTGTYIPNTEGFPPSQMHHSVSTPEATHYNQPQPNVVYLSPNAFGPRPTNVICPHCQHQVLTNTRPVSGLLTWLLCLLLIIFGCTLGCCLIPFCCDDCQDVEHSCPNCKAYIHQYKRLGN